MSSSVLHRALFLSLPRRGIQLVQLRVLLQLTRGVKRGSPAIDSHGLIVRRFETIPLPCREQKVARSVAYPRYYQGLDHSFGNVLCSSSARIADPPYRVELHCLGVYRSPGASFSCPLGGDSHDLYRKARPDLLLR